MSDDEPMTPVAAEELPVESDAPVESFPMLVPMSAAGGLSMPGVAAPLDQQQQEQQQQQQQQQATQSVGTSTDLPLSQSLERALGAAAATAASGPPVEFPATPEGLKDEINAWKEKNGGLIPLDLLGVEDDAHTASLIIGPDAALVQVMCDTDWRPQFVLTETPSLEKHIETLNEYLQTLRSASEAAKATAASAEAGNSPDAADADASTAFLKPPSATQVLDAFVASFLGTSPMGLSGAAGMLADSGGYAPQPPMSISRPLPSSGFTRDRPAQQDEDPQDPPRKISVEELESIVLPAVHRALQAEGNRQFEIDEWMRRIRAQGERGNLDGALDLIQMEIFGGALSTEFFPRTGVTADAVAAGEEIGAGAYFGRNGMFRRLRRTGHPSVDDVSRYMGGEGETRDAAERLFAELQQLRSLGNTKDLGFLAAPSSGEKDLFHWRIILTNFAPDSPLGGQLLEWKLRHGADRISDNSAVIKPEDIHCELKFPSDFPNHPPLLRIIHPRFKNVEDATVLNASIEFLAQLDGKSDTMSDDGASFDRAKLTASRAIELGSKAIVEWDPQDPPSISTLVQQIRATFENHSSQLQVDLDATAESSLPTIGGFWRAYDWTPAHEAGRADIEGGGRIVLPGSALEIMQDDLEGPLGGLYQSGSLNALPMAMGGLAQQPGGLHGSMGGPSPMIFEISLPSGKRSFCGVEEFSAPEGRIILPNWMLENIGAFEAQKEWAASAVETIDHCMQPPRIHVRRVIVPRGDFVRFQPHTSDWLKAGADVKAMLEWVLPRYAVLAQGDTLSWQWRDQTFKFDVLEVKPGRVVHMMDSDVKCDFAPPLDGGDDAEPIASEDAIADALKRAQQQINQSTRDQMKGSSASAFSAGTTTTDTPPASEGKKVSDSVGDPEGQEDVDWKRCGNCKRGVPIGAYSMHELSCARMNWHCDECDVVIKRSEREEHISAEHIDLTCELCGEDVPKRMMGDHKLKDCSRRTVGCNYCDLTFPYNELFEHEAKCGSHTERCDDCKRWIQKRDLARHMVTCAEERSKPKENTFRTHLDKLQAARAAESDMLICPTCYQPFQELDDLQVHMLTEHDGVDASADAGASAGAVDVGLPAADAGVDTAPTVADVDTTMRAPEDS